MIIIQHTTTLLYKTITHTLALTYYTNTDTHHPRNVVIQEVRESKINHTNAIYPYCGGLALGTHNLREVHFGMIDMS